MNKKVLLLTATALLGLTACGGGGGGSDPKTDTVTIVVEDLVEDNQGLNKIIKQKQKAFETAHPEITVKHNATVETDFANQLKYVKQTFDVSSASTPTMLKVNTNEYARQLYDDGYTKVLSGLANDAYCKDFYDDVLDGYTMNGEIIGFPVEIETPMLGFNKAILEKRKNELQQIGQDYTNLKIDTWDDYAEICKALTYSEGTKTIYGCGVTAGDYYQTFGIWATANAFDGVVQNDDGTISIDFKNNDSMKETINLFNSLFREGAVMKNGIDAKNADYFNYIWTGRLASFTYFPQWANWFKTSGSMSITDVDIYNIPQGDQAGLGAQTNMICPKGYVINKKATDEQAKACIEYLKFMYSSDVWDEKVKFAYDNYCDFVTFPALKTVDLKLVYQNIDETTGDSHFSDAIKTSLADGYISLINSAAYTIEIRSKLSDLFQYEGEASVLDNLLEALENQTKTNWLNAYNESKRKA